MSSKAYFWSREVGVELKLKSSLRFVLRELADCHNQNTHQCNPSIAHISHYTGLDRKTVMNAIALMAKMKVLSVTKRQGARTEYVLNFELIDITTSTKNGTSQQEGSSTKSGTSAKQKTDTKSGTSTKTNTSTKSGTQPVPKTAQPPVPKAVPEPISKPKTNLKDSYRGLSVADIPQGISIATACEFIEHRINIKKKLTQNALDRALINAINVSSDQRINLTADQVLELAIDKGWASITADWILNLGVSYATGQQTTGQDRAGEDTEDNWLDDDTIRECSELYTESQNDDGPNSGDA